MSLTDVPAYGLEEKIGFGVESFAAYGTPVAVTRFLRTITNQMTKAQPVEPLPSMPGSMTEVYRGAAADIPRTSLPVPDAGGPMTTELEFVEIGQLLLNLLCGSDGSGGHGSDGYGFTVDTGPSGAVTNMGEHIYDVPTLPAKMSDPLTVVRFNGQELHRYQGCYIRSIVFTTGATGVTQITVNFLSQDMTADAGSASISYSESAHVRIADMIFRLSTTVGDASPTVRTNIHSSTLTIERPLRAIPASGIGGNFIRMPMFESFWNISLELVTDWNSDLYQDLYNAATLEGRFVCAELEFLSTVDVPTSSALTPYQLTFRMPAMYMDGDQPLHGGGPGPIPETIKLKASTFDNGGTDEILRASLYTSENTTYD